MNQSIDPGARRDQHILEIEDSPTSERKLRISNKILHLTPLAEAKVKAEKEASMLQAHKAHARQIYAQYSPKSIL